MRGGGKTEEVELPGASSDFSSYWVSPDDFPGAQGLTRSDPGEEDAPEGRGLIAGRFIAFVEIGFAVISVSCKVEMLTRPCIGKQQHREERGQVWAFSGVPGKGSRSQRPALQCVQLTARGAGSLSEGPIPAGARAVLRARLRPGCQHPLKRHPFWVPRVYMKQFFSHCWGDREPRKKHGLSS